MHNLALAAAPPDGQATAAAAGSTAAGHLVDEVVADGSEPPAEVRQVRWVVEVTGSCAHLLPVQNPAQNLRFTAWGAFDSRPG
jgi:hypothetical protein